MTFVIWLSSAFSQVSSNETPKMPWYLRYFDDYERPENGWVEESWLNKSNTGSQNSSLEVDEKVIRNFAVTKDDVKPLQINVAVSQNNFMSAEKYIVEENSTTDVIVNKFTAEENSREDVIFEKSPYMESYERSIAVKEISKQNVTFKENSTDEIMPNTTLKKDIVVEDAMESMKENSKKCIIMETSREDTVYERNSNEEKEKLKKDSFAEETTENITTKENSKDVNLKRNVRYITDLENSKDDIIENYTKLIALEENDVMTQQNVIEETGERGSHSHSVEFTSVPAVDVKITDNSAPDTEKNRYFYNKGKENSDLQDIDRKNRGLQNIDTKENNNPLNIDEVDLRSPLQNRKKRFADYELTRDPEDCYLQCLGCASYTTESPLADTAEDLHFRKTDGEKKADKLMKKISLSTDMELRSSETFKAEMEHTLELLHDSPFVYDVLFNWYEHLYGSVSTSVTYQPPVISVKLVDATIKKLWLYGGIPLVAGGVTGNILVIIVLCRNNKVRSQAACLLLILLAIADILILLLDLLHRVVKAVSDYDFRLTSPFTCQFHAFIVHGLQQYVPGLIVLVSIERAVATVSQPGSSKIEALYVGVAAAGHLLVVIAVNVLFFQTHDIFWLVNTETLDKRQTCNALVYRGFLYKIWKWLENSLVSFVPISLIAIANGNTIIHIAHKWCKKTLTKFPSITKMVVSVSSVFVWATIPWMCFVVGENQWIVNREIDKENLHRIWVVVNLISYAQNSARLLIYALVSGAFRKQLRNSFKGRQVHPSSVAVPNSIRVAEAWGESTNHFELINI